MTARVAVVCIAWSWGSGSVIVSLLTTPRAIVGSLSLFQGALAECATLALLLLVGGTPPVARARIEPSRPDHDLSSISRCMRGVHHNAP